MIRRSRFMPERHVFILNRLIRLIMQEVPWCLGIGDGKTHSSLRAGDIIQGIDGGAVACAEDFLRMKKIRSGQGMRDADSAFGQ